MGHRLPALTAAGLIAAVAAGAAATSSAGAAPAAPVRAPGVGAAAPALTDVTGTPSPTDEVSDLEEGTPLPPSQDVRRIKALQRDGATGRGQTLGSEPSPTTTAGPSPTTSAPSPTTTGPTPTEPTPTETTPTEPPGAPMGFFRTSAVVPRELRVGERPYDAFATVPREGDGLVDAQGVRMFQFSAGSTVYNHPVGQAQYALRNLASYQRTRDRVYLDRAAANAQRLVDNRVESRGGWYYPYDFDFAVHGDKTMVLKAPWYSGMAQGQALSVFVRLHQHTGDTHWLEAARRTVATLGVEPVPGKPFASWVDDQKHLWLEEYPRPEVTNSERVLNGHIFAIYGLYDYWQLTHEPEALRLLDGSITTIAETLPQFRRPQWASIYSLGHQKPDKNYHNTHVQQALQLYQFTGRTAAFVDMANLLRTDYPRRTESGTAEFTPNAKVAYKLNSARQITSKRTLSFYRHTAAPADRYERTANGQVMLRVSVGPYKDWWFPVALGKTWLRGAKDVHTYSPKPLTVTFTAGTYSAYRYNASGIRTGAKTITFKRASNAPTATSAVVEARPNYYFTVGAWKGYWVPFNSKLRIR